jgi:hypothetical protein
MAKELEKLKNDNMKLNILKPKQRTTCDVGEVIINDETTDYASCEHCGDLGPFEACIADGSTRFCMTCADPDNGFEFEMEDGTMETLTKENVKEIAAECKKREEDYIIKRYNQIMKKRKK